MASAIARRAFLATLFGAPLVTPNAVTATEGFVISGHMTNAGQENERYYAIAQGVALMIDERIWPAAVAGADKLLRTDVEIALTRRRT
jgi:hypothetical protein